MKTTTCSLTVALAALTPILLSGTAQAALVSYLALDTSSGVTLNNGAAITSGSQGKFGEAASFDGTNDWAYVNAGNPIPGTGVRTVSTWVYQNAGATGLRTPVAFGVNGTGTKWEVDIDNDNGGIEVGIGAGRTIDSGLSGLTGTWSLIVTTLPTAGGNIQDVDTYFNGSIRTNSTGQGTSVNTTATNPLAGTAFRLGTSVNNAAGNTAPNIQFFGGRIDDVAVWNEALTANEIKGLYDVGMSVDLSYTADKFDLLKQRHDLGTGSTTIDSLEWTYASGLTGPAGLTSGPGGYTLILDALAGTGLTAIPEPSAALLGGLGLLALLRRRR
jgi:hypothetical protein